MTLDALEQVDGFARCENAADAWGQSGEVGVTRHECPGAGRAREPHEIVVFGIVRQLRPGCRVGLPHGAAANRRQIFGDIGLGHTGEFRAPEHPVYLCQELLRDDELEHPRPPALDEPPRSPMSMKQRRDEDVRIEDEPKQLFAAPLAPIGMNLFVRDAHRLFFGEVESCGNPREERGQSRLPQGFVHELGYGASLACRRDAELAKNVLIHVHRRLDLGHVLASYHHAVMKERR